MKMNLENVDKDQIKRCIDLCEKCIETDEKIIEETKEIIRRHEENIKRVEIRLQENRDRLTIFEGALLVKLIGEIITKTEEKAE
jgi:hypothetical protein